MYLDQRSQTHFGSTKHTRLVLVQKNDPASFTGQVPALTGHYFIRHFETNFTRKPLLDLCIHQALTLQIFRYASLFTQVLLLNVLLHKKGNYKPQIFEELVGLDRFVKHRNDDEKRKRLEKRKVYQRRFIEQEVDKLVERVDQFL